MYQIGTTNNLGQFSPDWMADFAKANYYSLRLALIELIRLTNVLPDPAPASNYATLDTAIGTVTTYTVDQLNGTLYIREEFDYAQYETPLRDFLQDAVDAADVMSELPRLFAGEQIKITTDDGQPFLFRLRPRGASKEA